MNARVIPLLFRPIVLTSSSVEGASHSIAVSAFDAGGTGGMSAPREQRHRAAGRRGRENFRHPMKANTPCLAAAALCGLLACSARAQSVTDPRITSWVTAKSAQYARVYETTSDKNSGNAVSTWPRAGLTNGGGGQSTPSYSDVQRVVYSNNYVYIYTTGLASYTMGNWLTPNGGVYTSWPTNRGAIHRIPRTPSIPTTKQKTNGSGGVLVNGVFVWANGDAQSYNTSTGVVSMQGGQGIWNRLAGVAEAFNFDTAYGHQPNNGAYHNHVNPIALRYQLGDAVSYNASTKTYSEATPTKHSPLIGWANDGLPIYGPHGYASAMNPSSGVRRMVSGFQKRDGSNGTTNLASTGRTTLPVWAASVQGRSQTLAASEYGPSTTATYQVAPGVTGTYTLGMFAEDYEYLGDVGKTQGVDFDLNRQNVRFCVTPEFPSGTYAYFVCIDASGTTVFPDIINQEFFGTAAMGQGTVSSISESVTEHVRAGPSATINVAGAAAGSGVALTWNSAEGATYKVESSPDNSTWTTLSGAVTSGGTSTSYTATTANYYRVTLSALATYDTDGTFGTPVGTTGTLTYHAATISAPTIATQPAATTVAVGASVSFTVVAGGTGPFTYQWRKDGAMISGATAATYTINSAQSADAGSYTCIVTNSAGSTTSNAATLTVTGGTGGTTTAPAITTQPATAGVTIGGSATFSVAASGTTPFTYQWRKDGAAISGATAATLTISNVQAGDAGGYSVVVTNGAGSATSAAATLTVTTSPVAPSMATQPASATVTAGANTSFSAAANGTSPLTYQWLKNGATISGATNATLMLNGVQISDAASYAVRVTNSAGSITSAAATLTVIPSTVVETKPAARVINLAVRARVGGDAGTPTTGFVIGGTGAQKRVIVRAVGPTLSGFGVSGSLRDPRLQLWSAGGVLATNDNWQAADAGAFTSVGAFPLAAASADAAIVTTLGPGAYTTPISDPTNAGGIVLIECYDAAPNDASLRLVNASALAYAGAGDDALIPGFVISGEGNVRVLVRAVGPGLAAFGVSGAMSDPKMTLYSGTTVVGANNDWENATNAAEVASAARAVSAFALAPRSFDAALLVTLPAGAYTANVSPDAGEAGAVLLEVYVVP